MQLNEIMYDSWDKLQRFALDLKKAWSYKSKCKQMLGRNIFDKVDEISHFHFFLSQYSKK